MSSPLLKLLRQPDKTIDQKRKILIKFHQIFPLVEVMGLPAIPGTFISTTVPPAQFMRYHQDTPAIWPDRRVNSVFNETKKLFDQPASGSDPLVKGWNIIRKLFS